MNRDEIARIFAQRLEAWAGRDLDALTAAYAADAVVESPTHGRQTTPEAIRGVFTTWFEAFPDLVFRQDDVLVDGDRAALFFTIDGTHAKPFAGVPPTGRRMEIRGVVLFAFRDGKIVHERRYYDSTALLVQIGLLKAKPL